MAHNLAFMIAGFVLFILAGCGVPSGRASLGWLGMACVTAAFILPAL